MQFPFDQSLLMPTQAQASMDMYKQLLQTIALPEMMRTQRDTAKADLQNKQLVNQFYPQATQSDINYKNALTGETKEKTGWMGIDELLQAARTQNQADQVNQSKYRFGPGFQTIKAFSALPKAEKEQYYADHPGAYQALMAVGGNQALADQALQNFSSSNVQSSTGNSLNKMIQDLITKKMGIPMPGGTQSQANNATGLSALIAKQNMPNGTISPEQAHALVGSQFSQPGGQAPQLQTAQPQGQMPQPQVPAPQQAPENAPNAPYNGTTDFTPTNEQVKRSSYYAKLQSNRSGNTDQINRRIDSGEAMSNLFEQPHVLQNLSILTKYSGKEGQAKLLWDKLFNPKEYLQYQNASDQLGTIISGSLKGIESIPTSNEGMRVGKDFINKAATMASLKGDPSATAQYLINGIDLITDEQNALLKAGQKAYPNLIPQHKHVKTMLDDIAAGKKPEDVLTLGKNPDIGKITTGIERNGRTETLSGPSPAAKIQTFNGVDVSQDSQGKWIVKNPKTGQWQYEE